MPPNSWPATHSPILWRDPKHHIIIEHARVFANYIYRIIVVTMEATYLLEIDSSQRDVTLYPNSNTYTVSLNRPMYNVSNIKLVSGRIPLPQWTIDAFNDTFKYNLNGAGDITVTIAQQDYLTGAGLATELTTQLTAVSITASFDINTGAITFTHATLPFTLTMGSNSPAAVLGLLPNTTSSSVANNIITGSIDLGGPTSLILSLSADRRDDIKNVLYVEGGEDSVPMHYFGRIITVAYTEKRLINFNGNSDPVRNLFYKGTEGYMDKIDINFFWNNFKEVNPYDFKLRNHVLKFEITCSLDKLSLSKENDMNKRLVELPPKLELDRFNSTFRIWGNKQFMVYGGASIVLGLIVLILSSFKYRRRI